MNPITLIGKTQSMATKRALLACIILIGTNEVSKSQGYQESQESQESQGIHRPLTQQEIVLAKSYHRQLERAYNISPPEKYNKASNYADIASMHGPKGAYRPSVPNVTAICYGVFLTRSGRILPDPQYPDHTTVENTTKALQRSYELAKLEYLSIKTYNGKIAQANMLEENKNKYYVNNK